MQFVQIIALSVVAAVMYGIVHDQVTVRVCLEYFTVFHPKIVDTESPTVLALVWGVIATWWVGLPLGIILATAARAGDAPKRTARSLVRPLVNLLCAMFVAALLAGCAGYVATSAGWFKPSGWAKQFISPEKHAAFVADYCAHNMSYFLGGIGGLFLSGSVFFSRARELSASLSPR